MIRLKSFLILFIFGVLLVYIISSASERVKNPEVTSPAWNEIHNTALLAEMENRMAKEEDTGDSKSSMEEIPDYKKLFPDLYTEYALHESMEEGKKIAYLTFDDGPSTNTK